MDKLISSTSSNESLNTAATTIEPESPPASPLGHLTSPDGSERTVSRNSDSSNSSLADITKAEIEPFTTSIDSLSGKEGLHENSIAKGIIADVTYSNTSTVPIIPKPNLISKLTHEQQISLIDGETVVTKVAPETKKSTFSKLFYTSKATAEPTSQSSIYTAYKLVDRNQVPLQKLEDTLWIPELNKDTLPFCSQVDDSLKSEESNIRRAKYSFEINATIPIPVQITDEVSMRSDKKAIQEGGFQLSFEQEGTAKNIQSLKGNVTAMPYNGQTLVAYQLAFDLKGTAALAATAAKTARIPVKESIVERILENLIEQSTLLS